MKIIGREKEVARLTEYLRSDSPEFVAVYGRRRVGKTFLINEFFREDFTFSVTALMDVNRSAQLRNFHAALKKYGDRDETPPADWLEAFDRLISLLTHSRRKGKKVVFIDELPWFDTKKSGFLSALEHFWNGWAASNPDILLIVCGSATSWMINKLIRNRGGLHNRVTRRIQLAPFTLRETEAYLSYLNIVWERRDIALAYMTFGGIPFYLNQLRPGMSYAQNVDALCFEKDAFMRGEFEALYSSLFRNADAHVDILEALSAKKRGLTREEILARTGLTSGGGASVVLRELEQCGFIEKFNDYSGKHGRYVYQLTDFFTLFYFKQMKRNKQLGSGYWSKMIGSGAYYNWAGQTFEKLCLLHIENIRAKLGISGILATPFAWNGSGTDAGAQIDLLIDRTDGIINIVECKFAGEPFVVDKQYSENLRNKTSAFKQTSKTRKALHLTMITTFGVKANKYAGMIQSEVLLDDLFM